MFALYLVVINNDMETLAYLWNLTRQWDIWVMEQVITVMGNRKCDQGVEMILRSEIG